VADKKRRPAGDEFDGADDRAANGREEFDGDGDDDFDEMLDEADGAEAATASSRRSGSGVRAKPRPAVRARAGDEGPGLLGRVVRFIREVVAELQKVIWPTRKDLLTYTAVVLVFVSVLMTVIALLDVGFAELMFLVFGGANN
jgi:preprotein translocase subunit SecE